MGAVRQLIPVITGPTAVGKTAVAMALSRYWPVTVISADSRQVYRGLDIGTAKPSPEDRRRVRHLGLDLVDPGERYSAGRYAGDAAQWIEDLARGERPVVVGGTGFYIRALADGLFNEPPLDAGQRARLGQWTSRASGLGRMAARLDAGYSGGGRQRAARAVEVAFLTGRPLSWWQQHAKAHGVMRPWYVLLRVPRSVLHDRIARRVDSMLREGFVDEVQRILATGLPPRSPGLDAVGYREVVDYLEGKMEVSQLATLIAARTRRYAKRQETWFRHQLHGYDVLTLNATESADAVARRIVAEWEKRTEPCELG